MKPSVAMQLLRLHLGENDRHQGRPLWEAVLERSREAGAELATVYRGIEGYGASSRIHRPGYWGRTQDAPMVVTILAAPDAMAALRPQLEALAVGGLIALSPAEVIRYGDDAC